MGKRIGDYHSFQRLRDPVLEANRVVVPLAVFRMLYARVPQPAQLLHKWCDENLSGDWARVRPNTCIEFTFRNDEDAVMFRMKWGLENQ